MSNALRPDDVPAAAEYERRRDTFRREVIAAKRQRTVAIGDNVTLLFENRLTVLYQVLEMLRIEKTTDAAGIQAELDAYNPLIPGGSDWRATMLIEFDDAEERRVQLKYMRLIEREVYARIGETRIAAVADEDLERSDATKTSAVHFLRFPLPAAAIERLRGGAELAFGTAHPRYRYETMLPEGPVRSALLDDLR